MRARAWRPPKGLDGPKSLDAPVTGPGENANPGAHGADRQFESAPHGRIAVPGAARVGSAICPGTENVSRVTKSPMREAAAGFGGPSIPSVLKAPPRQAA